VLGTAKAALTVDQVIALQDSAFVRLFKQACMDKVAKTFQDLMSNLNHIEVLAKNKFPPVRYAEIANRWHVLASKESDMEVTDASEPRQRTYQLRPPVAPVAKAAAGSSGTSAGYNPLPIGLALR